MPMNIASTSTTSTSSLSCHNVKKSSTLLYQHQQHSSTYSHKLRQPHVYVSFILFIYTLIGILLLSVGQLADASNVSLLLKTDKRRIIDFGTFAFGGIYGGRVELSIQDLYLHNEEDMFSGLAGGKIGFAIDNVLSPSSARRARTAALKATKATIVPSTAESSSSSSASTPAALISTPPPQLIAGRSFNTLRVIEEESPTTATEEEVAAVPTTPITSTMVTESSSSDSTTSTDTNLDEESTTMGDDVVLPSNKCFVDEASMVPESRYLLKLEETILNAALTVLKAAREEFPLPSSSSSKLDKSTTSKIAGNVKKGSTALSTKRPLQPSTSRPRKLSQELATLIPNSKERRRRLSLALANSKIVFDISGRTPGYYALFFYNCKGGNSAGVPSPITFRVKTSQYNIMDEGVGGGGKVSYLPFGDTHLPAIYLFFFLVFVGCGVVWYQVVHGASALDAQEVASSRGRQSTTPKQHHLGGGSVVSRVKLIHKLMGALLLLKCITLLLNAAMLHHRKVTGQMNAAIDYFFYSLQFFKGIFLFTIILLLGSGWSLLRPLLTDRDRKILLLLIPLQLVVNIALIVLDETSEGSKYWSWWKDILRAVDICCCVCVMLPVAFSMRSLQQQSAVLEERQRVPRSPSNNMTTTTAVNAVTSDLEDGGGADKDEGRHRLLGTPQHQPNHLLLELSEEDTKMSEKASKKLKFFSGFYIATAAFMYLTRVLVDYLASTASYQYTWVAPTLGEGVTLAYYCYCGYAFRPVAKQSWEETTGSAAHHNQRRKYPSTTAGSGGGGGGDGVVNQKNSGSNMLVVQEMVVAPTPPQPYDSNTLGSAASPLPHRPPSSSDYRSIHRKNNNGNNKVTSEMMLGEELEEIPV